jgi:hypothetical protein
MGIDRDGGRAVTIDEFVREEAHRLKRFRAWWLHQRSDTHPREMHEGDWLEQFAVFADSEDA